MKHQHITNHPTPATPSPPPEPDDDRPQRRPHLDIWSRRSVLSILGGGLVGAFFGLILANLVGRAFRPHHTPILLAGPLLGLLVGSALSYLHLRNKLGKGTRVLNRDLPHGARPPQQRRVSPNSPHIVTRRDAFAMLGTLPPRHVSQLVGNHSRILAVALSPDGRLALSAGSDGMVSLWDVQTGFEIRSLQGFRYHTHSVAFSPDGRLVVAAGVHLMSRGGAMQGGVYVWDAESGQLLRQIEFADAAWSLAFHPAGREIVVGGNSHLRLWELDGPSPTALIPVSSGLMLAAEEIRAVAVAEEGHLVLVGCARSEDMRLINLDRNEEVRRFEKHGMWWKVYRTAGVVSVAFSPDGMKALSGSWDQTAIVWNLLTGEALVRFTGHRGFWGWRGVVGVAWLGNGDRAMSVSENGVLCVWDTKTGAEEKRYYHGSGVTCLATTIDGRLALTGGRNGVIRVWDLVDEAV